MTNYGTIPTSSSSVPINLDYITRAKERLKEGLGTRRPWRQMFDRHCFSLPKSLGEAYSHVRTNTSYFLMNYALIVLLIIFVSLIYQPISLIVFIAMMALWTFFYFLRDEPLVVFNRTIGDRIVLIILSVLTLIALFFTHATSEILIALLVGVVVVFLHSAFRNTDDLTDEEAAADLLH